MLNIKIDANNNKGIMNRAFGKLSQDYCIYFYILAVIGFIFSLIFFFYLLYLLFVNGKKVDSNVYVMTVSGCISYFFFYFTYRLLYSMCMSSL